MKLFNIFKNKNKKIDIKILEQHTDQKIFNILQQYLPNNWQEVIFFAGYYKEDCGYFKYWIKLESGKFIDCFNLIPEPKPGEIDKAQEQLMKIKCELKFIRNQLTEKNKWVCMLLRITNKGQLSKHYDYADGIAKNNLMLYVESYKNQLNEEFAKNNK